MTGDRPMAELLSALGTLDNAFHGGGDRGQAFPQSDAEDLRRYGLDFIPGEVTLARRRGERVGFYRQCPHPCCWYWQFENGDRSYYWTRADYEQLRKANGRKRDSWTGPCPTCGNPHTSGGMIRAADVQGVQGEHQS